MHRRGVAWPTLRGRQVTTSSSARFWSGRLESHGVRLREPHVRVAGSPTRRRSHSTRLSYRWRVVVVDGGHVHLPVHRPGRRTRYEGPDPRFSSPGAAPVAAAARSRRRNLPTPPSLSPYRRRRHMLCRRALPTAGALDKPYPPDEHTAFCVRHLLAFPPVLEQMPSVDQLCGPALYHRVPEGPGDSIQTRQARCRGSRSRLARASGAL
ncbi:hypothetical protein Purlil1_1543 [Purpureocillium lilacinum]|uniref:Uncharacterized protein n=1 Tax=Purpureocillium lilacinum TaxID=33203 RepID=A0ABR0CCW3_PURLI|nr:hypothetical protein Purlil1_1543 [Purpureocillium lilacinum]